MNEQAFSDFHVIDGQTAHGLIYGDIQGCFDAVARAYIAHSDGHAVNPRSVFMTFPDRPKNRIIALPAHLNEPWNVSGVKWIASYPDNTGNGLPRASAVIILNEAEHGYPFACLEGSVISAARTAASAVIAAHHLCPEPGKVRSLGIVGTGLIARHIYRFLIAAEWQIDNLVLFDSNPDAAQKFSEQVNAQRRHGRVEFAESVSSLLASCDLIVFATTAPAPYVNDLAAIKHCPVILHISLRDLGLQLILNSWNVVDSLDHVLSANTSPHLAEQALGSRDFVTASIANVLAGEWRPDHSRSIIFSPFGLGVLDVAVGKWVYDRAVAEGRFQVIKNFQPAMETNLDTVHETTTWLSQGH